jgi:hypothetical protein
MEWINVDERLPDETDKVWIWDGNDALIGRWNGFEGVNCGFYIDGTHASCYGFCTDEESNNVTHWKPLIKPEPPKTSND